MEEKFSEGSGGHRNRLLTLFYKKMQYGSSNELLQPFLMRSILFELTQLRVIFNEILVFYINMFIEIVKQIKRQFHLFLAFNEQLCLHVVISFKIENKV